MESHQYIKTQFSHKPFAQLNSNFFVKTPFHKIPKIYAKYFGHMTKMAATPIYGKNPLKIFFSRTRRLMTMGLSMWHCACRAYQVCSNDVPRLTLIYLTSRSNLLSNAFKTVFFLKVDFLNTVEAKIIILT